MRIATASAIFITILAGNSLAEDQRVNINNPLNKRKQLV